MVAPNGQCCSSRLEMNPNGMHSIAINKSPIAKLTMKKLVTCFTRYPTLKGQSKKQNKTKKNKKNEIINQQKNV